MNRDLMDFISRVDHTTGERIVSVTVDGPVLSAVIASGETIGFHSEVRRWVIERPGHPFFITSESIDDAWHCVIWARSAAEQMRNPPLPPACRERLIPNPRNDKTAEVTVTLANGTSRTVRIDE